MLKRLNHVAIAVPDLEAAAATYRDVLGATVSPPQALPEHGVTVVFVELGNTKVELIEPLGENSPIAGFLEKSPAGGHSIEVKMTLTAPGCGMGPVIAEDARAKIARLPTVEAAKVHIVWDPQWTPQMISDTGRKVLGIE